MNNQRSLEVCDINGNILYSVSDFAEYDLTHGYSSLRYDRYSDVTDELYRLYLSNYGIGL